MDNVNIDTDRALGAILGSAVGDALGAPFEFGAAGAYSARFPGSPVDGTSEMIGGGPLGWAPGEFTDDTAMAVVQAESLLRCRGIDGADLFAAFRVWAESSRDVGNQTRAVLSAGLPWNEAAAAHYRRHPNGAAGNGSLMRAVPSAVYFAPHALDASVAAARALSSLTHGDPAAACGCALFHAMIHAALRGCDQHAALDVALAVLPDDEHRFRSMLDDSWQPHAGALPNGSVWGCLAQAVWAVRTTRSFSDALTAAIDLGGDTDTVAAVTGGLAGACYGTRAIPQRWLQPLHGHVGTIRGTVTYRAAELEQLAHHMLAGFPREHSTANGDAT